MRRVVSRLTGKQSESVRDYVRTCMSTNTEKLDNVLLSLSVSSTIVVSRLYWTYFFSLKDLSPVFKCTTSCSYSNKLLVAQNSQPNAIISNNRRRFGEEQSKIPDFNFYNGLFGNLVLYNTLFPIFRRFPLSHLELKSKWTGFNKINYRSDLLRYICVLLRLI